MTKHTHTTYSYSCDLCGAELPDLPAAQIRQPIDHPVREPWFSVDLCEPCTHRPITDLLAHLEQRQEAKTTVRVS